MKFHCFLFPTALSELMNSHQKSLGILFVLSFIGDMNLAIINIASILIATRAGADTIAVGWLASAYGLAMIIMPALLGKLFEHIDRKISISIAALGQLFVALFFIGFGNSIIPLIIGNAVLGIVNSLFWPAIEASISERSGHAESTHKTSFFNYCMAWTFGSGIAPYIGGSLSDINVILAFMYCAIVYFIGFLLILFGFPSQNNLKNPDSSSIVSASSRMSQQKPSEEITQSASLPSNGVLKIQIGLMLAVMVSTMGIKVLLSYFPNYAAMEQGLGWTGTLIGSVSLGFGIGRVGYYIIGRFFEVKYSNIPICLAIFGSSVLVFSVLRNEIALGILFLISGIAAAVLYVTSLELLLKIERKAKSTAAGVFDSFIGLGAAVSPLIAGLIASKNLLMPFILYAILAYIISIITLILGRKRANNQ